MQSSAAPGAAQVGATESERNGPRSLRDKFLNHLNSQDLNGLRSLLSEDVRSLFTSINASGCDREYALMVIKQVLDAFPDMQFTVVKDAANRNVVFSEVEWSGTHLKPLGNAPATNVRISNRKNICELETDQSDMFITSIRLFSEGNSLFKELGISAVPFAMHEEDSPQVQALRLSLLGRVITPLSPDYRSICILASGCLPSEPAVLILCQGVSDVITAIAFCKEFQKANPTAPPMTIRSGGHSFSGVSSNIGGCVIDLRLMKGVFVDALERSAWVEAGACMGHVDREAFVHDELVTVTGQVSNTGCGGLISGGGYGLLSCKYGMTIDNLLACEMVTADGTIRHCTAKENSELFWAVKGGGRWLGVLTKFKLQLHKLEEPTCNAVLMWDSALLEKCAKTYLKLPSQHACSLMAIATPPPLGGTTVVLFHLVVFGDQARANAVKDFMMKEIGAPPIAELLPLGERPWPVINSSVDFIWPYGKPVYTKGAQISSEDEDKFLDFTKTFLAKRASNIDVGFDWCFGEYCNKAGTEAGFHHEGKRCSTIFCVIMFALDPANEPESREEAKRFFKEFLEATKNFQRPAKYINFNEEGSLTFRTSKEVHDRFQKVKNEVDPENLFGGSGP